MAQHEGSPIDNTPCKHTAPTCVSDFGCVFLVGLPMMPDPTLLTLTAWASVRYPGAPQTLHGLSVKPALGPPISRA